MARVLLAVFLSCAFVSVAAAKEPIMLGVYKLKGTNPDGLKKYEGQINIQKEGPNYRVTWFIGPTRSQAQVGIGILENEVLSIGYMDASGKDFGVVSLRLLKGNVLKGRWASMLSRGSHGEEEFTFEAEKVPEQLKPKPFKAETQGTI